MLEDAPNQQASNFGEYNPLRQALLRPIQYQLAKQGIQVSPEEALLLLEQKFEYDAMRYLQQDLAEQGIAVSPEEAPELFMQKFIDDIKRGMQQDLAEHSIDISPDEALAIQKLRIIHLMMGHTVTSDPHDAIERIVSDDSPRP